MSKWVGVVQHDKETNERLGETLINLDNVSFITCRDNLVHFTDGTEIKVNIESLVNLIDITSGGKE